MVQVGADGPGRGKPAGTVTFFDGSATLGTATVRWGRGGLHDLGAVARRALHQGRLRGDAEFLGGTSAPVPRSVDAMGFGTVTTLTARARTSKSGRPITLTARVKTAGAAKGDARARSGSWTGRPRSAPPSFATAGR